MTIPLHRPKELTMIDLDTIHLYRGIHAAASGKLCLLVVLS